MSVAAFRFGVFLLVNLQEVPEAFAPVAELLVGFFRIRLYLLASADTGRHWITRRAAGGLLKPAGFQDRVKCQDQKHSHHRVEHPEMAVRRQKSADFLTHDRPGAYRCC